MVFRASQYYIKLCNLANFELRYFQTACSVLLSEMECLHKEKLSNTFSLTFRCQYRYRCSRGYRCKKLRPRYFSYGQCYLHYRFTSNIAVCPRTHFVRQCHCRRGCLSATLYLGRICICNCGGKAAGAACCARPRYVRFRSGRSTCH